MASTSWDMILPTMKAQYLQISLLVGTVILAKGQLANLQGNGKTAHEKDSHSEGTIVSSAREASVS